MAAKLLILVGERDESKRAHAAMETSIKLFGAEVGYELPYQWIRTDAIGLQDSLTAASGIWCAPGSPYASTVGALAAIKCARERGIPFLGTCGGFQHALMEYAQNVLHCPAAHQELEPGVESPLIAKLSCSLMGAKSKVMIKAESRYSELMGSAEAIEEFNCNYGVAPRFQDLFEGADLEFVAHDEVGQPRVFWHRAHPFFAGSLFQPERRAFSGAIHPLVYSLLERT